jgi:hypothetical protein
MTFILALPLAASAQGGPPADSTKRPQKLPPVTVQADSTDVRLSDPYGFEARKRNSTGGVFIREQEIEQKHLIESEQIFHGIPSVWVDTGGIVWIQRGRISFRDYYLPSRRLNQTDMCVGAQVMVDRVEMPQPFNINEIEPGRIRAIEIYRGPATTPPMLRGLKAVCGTIAIWTKP